MNDEDFYGVAGSNDPPDGGPGQDATARDGLPGYPVEGYPGWRAGAFGSGNGLMGMMRAPDDPEVRQTGSAQPGIDWDFIHQREAAGGPGLSMSVPEDGRHRVLGHSGPTIGYGFDLGQRSVEDLRRLGLSQPIIDKLTPYVGLRGTRAQAYVKAHPLAMERPDVDAVDRAIENQTAQGLASRFDAASQVGAFASLPSNTQTAIADLYHQYGVNNPAKVTPTFWRQVTGGDWQGAYDNLQDFKDQHPTRRAMEAARLKQDMDAGILPPRPGP